MYSIIIAIHIVFIFLCHLLEFRFLEGIFLILCIFFLFYFSPLFFSETSDSQRKKKHFSFDNFLEKLSPRESIFIPLLLLYIAIYGFIISSIGIFDSIFFIHTLLTIAIFLIIFGYIMSFEWNNEMFFEILWFHIYITFFTGILFFFLNLIWIFILSPFYFILWSIGIFAWVFFLKYSRGEMIFYIPFFLINIIITLFLFFQYFFRTSVLDLFITISTLSGVFFFEYFPKISIFSRYIMNIRFFSLSVVLLGIPFLVYSIFIHITLPCLLLIIIILFLFSIHIRFSNYISYGIGLALIFFLYSIFFISLLSTHSIFPVLMFVFFLPFLLISLTYFWEEQYEYDFMILHYSAILFSGIYSIYSIFFIWWWSEILFMISSCVFWLAVLFFLSYFRFKKN